MKGKTFFRLIQILLAGFIILLGSTACLAAVKNNPVVQSSATADLPEVTLQPTEEPDPFPGWVSYVNDLSQFSFYFPESWFGPDIYEVDGDLRLVIGSDVVYPYGTDRTDQIYTEKNSYYITILYRKNINNIASEDFFAGNPWVSTYAALQILEDGESIETARARDIRVKEYQLGAFSGLEYISTLSDTAQTEHFYVREIFLMDENLNVLIITGSPNNVEIGEGENWREVYQKIDQENLEILYKVVESIKIDPFIP